MKTRIWKKNPARVEVLNRLVEVAPEKRKVFRALEGDLLEMCDLKLTIKIGGVVHELYMARLHRYRGLIVAHHEYLKEKGL